MAVMAIKRQKKMNKNLLLENRKAYEGMKHQEKELYKVYINHDPGMIMTYFMAKST